MNGAGGIKKLPTGISGLDQVALGGLPVGRPTLVSGTTGSGKTLFSLQFLAAGIRLYDEPGVFVTFEEQPAELRRNVASLGFDVEGWEAGGKWAFVDASAGWPEEGFVVGTYDFGALISRIDHAVRTIGAKRVAIDSPEAIFSRLGDPGIVRRELFRVLSRLKELGPTSVVTAERTYDYDSISRFGVEEFVADNVVLLRNVLEQEKRRRTVEILKFRGARHRSGEYSFTIDPDEGITVIPVSSTGLGQPGDSRRLSLGTAELDGMCGGGLYANSVCFVAGPTGTGKTLMATHFVAAGVASGERSLLYSFEESRDQLFRNAISWGFDPSAMEESGCLRILFDYPEAASLADHFTTLRQAIEEFGPSRLVIDSVGALEQVSTGRGLRDFILGLAVYLKERGITAIFTATTSLFGGGSPTEAHLSSLADGIILLRYVELVGEVRRAISVLKMRGSDHDLQIRGYTIDGGGIHVGQPYANVTGILLGPSQLVPSRDGADDAILVLGDEERADRGPT